MYTAVVILPFAVVAVYLTIVGRGVVGRLVGAAMVGIAGLLYVLPQFLPRAFARSDVGGIALMVVSAVGVLLVVGGWGVARRTGWVWLIGLPIALFIWAIHRYFLVPQLLLPLTRDSSSTFLVFLGPLFYVGLVREVPIVICWGLELLGRAASSKVTQSPAASSPGHLPAALLPAQPQQRPAAQRQGHWQWHPATPQSPQPHPHPQAARHPEQERPRRDY